MDPIDFAIGRVLDGHKHTFNGEWNCTCGVPGWPSYGGWLHHFTGEMLHALALAEPSESVVRMYLRHPSASDESRTP